MRDPEGKVTKVKADDVKERSPVISTMPPLALILPKREVRDVVAYLVTLKATICAVKVLPTLAPKMTAIDWENVMTPAVMNPTTRTVVTDEEFSTAVTTAPVIAPRNRFRVSLPRSILRPSPAAAALVPAGSRPGPTTLHREA